MNEKILGELKTSLEQATASGDLATPAQIDEQTALFRARFGPQMLSSLDGEALLRLMHGRQEAEPRCMTYWLEFKNDEEFTERNFGGIRGGTALKFGIFQRQHDGAWITGSPNAQRMISLEEAVKTAHEQRAELLNGLQVLNSFSPVEYSDQAYARLQFEMDKAAPTLANVGWAHKYWFLCHPNLIDAYHSPSYQRFHLLKLLQMPPDKAGIILKNSAARFLCAGRFLSAAHELGVPIAVLNRILDLRDPFHRYWKIGTTAGSVGESNWPAMRDGAVVSIGWKGIVPDLSEVIRLEKADAKNQIRDFLFPGYGDRGTATRKAGEVLNFASAMAENDLVLACEGQKILGIGRVCGPYNFDDSLYFPHTRPVEWLSLEPWTLSDPEGPRTTLYEMGKSANNLLEIEHRLAHLPYAGVSAKTESAAKHLNVALKPLDPFSARVDSILRRKGQVILYGPPGTGKTYRAIEVAQELASRRTFSKSFGALSMPEHSNIVGDNGMVRMCTFHPSWGYEDFMEGLRPKTINGQMVFEVQDGVFKRLCLEAAAKPESHFFLIIDEINRGDLPRILGELMTVIELDKRDKDIVLPITGEKFKVPKNVFLIGTMNTADRSISLLDAALRRRFGFVELMPDSSCLGHREVGGLALGPWLDALNLRLRKHLKRDARNLQVGHAYLLPTQPITSVTEFARVVRDDLIPLLEEYCYDDFAALKLILGEALVDSEGARIREELFAVNRESDLIQALTFEEMAVLVLADSRSSEEADALIDEDEDSEENGMPAI